MSYDDNNVFARILRGELPCHKIYEDAETLAFMDVMPRLQGHSLVIPKSPARNMLDASPLQLAACIATVQKVAVAAMRAFDAPGVTIEQYNEAVSGQTVFHLHYHVLPRKPGVPIGQHSGKMADPSVLAADAERIRAALG